MSTVEISLVHVRLPSANYALLNQYKRTKDSIILLINLPINAIFTAGVFKSVVWFSCTRIATFGAINASKELSRSSADENTNRLNAE